MAPITISFSGIDGSGKTTQIQLLKKRLDSQQVSYCYIHLFSQGGSAISHIHERKLFAYVIKKIRNIDKTSLAGTINFAARIVHVFLDSWITWLKDRFFKKHSLILYDRYFYDVLAIIIFDFPQYRKVTLCCCKMLPKPDCVIILNASPELVVRRKGEHSMADAVRYTDIYKLIANSVGIESLNADCTVDQLHTDIIGRLQSARTSHIFHGSL